MKEVVKREGCCLKTYIHLCLFLWEKKGFSLSLVPSIGLFGDFHLFQAGVGPSGHLYFQNNIKVCGSTCQFFAHFSWSTVFFHPPPLTRRGNDTRSSGWLLMMEV